MSYSVGTWGGCMYMYIMHAYNLYVNSQNTKHVFPYQSLYLDKNETNIVTVSHVLCTIHL